MEAHPARRADVPNGEKVLARDCVASIKRWGARDAFGQALMQRTDEMSAPDDKTIVFRLKQPFALLPDALCHGASNMCAMMPEHIAETDPFKQFTEIVGSGPFRFKADERVQGSLFVYERFDGLQAARGRRKQLHRRPEDRAFRPRRMARSAGTRYQGRGAAGGRDGLVGEPHGRPAAVAQEEQHRHDRSPIPPARRSCCGRTICIRRSTNRRSAAR